MGKLRRAKQNLERAWHVQDGMGSAGTPCTATPRGRSFLKVLSEQQRLQKELAAAQAAREAAEARALVSADEAAAAVGVLPHPVCIASIRPAVMNNNPPLHSHAYILPALSAGTCKVKLGCVRGRQTDLSSLQTQAQWAQAVTHENEKLHQLTSLQKAIVGSLQDGHRMADAALWRADELARTSQHAQRDSPEASKLHTSLLQHTGHAKVSAPPCRPFHDSQRTTM